MIKSKDSGTTALTFLNKEMEDIMKIAKYLQRFGYIDKKC